MIGSPQNNFQTLGQSKPKNVMLGQAVANYQSKPQNTYQTPNFQGNYNPQWYNFTDVIKGQPQGNMQPQYQSQSGQQPYNVGLGAFQPNMPQSQVSPNQRPTASQNMQNVPQSYQIG